MLETLETISKMRTKIKDLYDMTYEDNEEFVKSIVIINSLIDKAEKVLRGDLPKSRWLWVEESYTTPEMMVEQANEILEKLKKGILPFKGRFTEIGGIVIDHTLIKKDDFYHLFYIRGNACTTWVEYPTNNFGHSVSKDLKKWQVEQPIMQSTEGSWDDYQIWAPHILHYNDEYWMFYTGVNYNVAQAIGLVRSADLVAWRRFGDTPIIKPGDWGYWTKKNWSDCRDPMVLQGVDRFYIYYTSALKDKINGKLVYCIGISSSIDLVNWIDEGFVKMPESFETPPESPFVVKRNDKYYMFYTDYKAGTVYAVSDDPVKGWTDPPKDKRIVKPYVSASEIFEENGKWYLTYISHEKNQLSFFEIEELIWNEDESFSLIEI